MEPGPATLNCAHCVIDHVRAEQAGDDLPEIAAGVTVHNGSLLCRDHLGRRVGAGAAATRAAPQVGTDEFGNAAFVAGESSSNSDH